MSAQKQVTGNYVAEDQQQQSDFSYGSFSKNQVNHQSNAHQAEFQKNYPKNIFIPLIQYLTQLGYKEAYEKCVGCRSQFQGKNVVSLNSIYTLITQNWFGRNINKESALSHIANKILINSKIKKKLFHLLIAHLILRGTYHDVKQFKRRISRQANEIAKKQLPHDQVFNYPNAIIYLLFLFRKILVKHVHKKSYCKIQEEFQKLSIQEEAHAEPKGKNYGSKQEYKFYVKEIVHIFSNKNLCVQSSTDILEETKQTIMEKDKQLKEKYHLVEGMPNWLYFIELVVIKCFQCKKKDMKITNHIFNQWINQCKNKILSIQCRVGDEGEGNKKEGEWPTESIHWIKQQMEFGGQAWNALPTAALDGQSVNNNPKTDPIPVSTPMSSAKPKQFTPIILTNQTSK